MHFFAVFFFLALCVMGLTMLAERVAWRLPDVRAFLAGGWGVALAWLANFNMWIGWHIGHLRYAWVGVTLTGAALGGSALLMHALVRFFSGLYRKFEDQAVQLERQELTKVEPLSRAS